MVAGNKAVVIVHCCGVKCVPIDHAQGPITAYKLEQGHSRVGIFAVAVTLILGVFPISNKRPVDSGVCHTARIDKNMARLEIVVGFYDGGGNASNNRLKVRGVVAPIETGLCPRLPIATGPSMGMGGANDHVFQGVGRAVAQLQTLNDF